MAYIKSIKTKKGLTFYLIDPKSEGKQCTPLHVRNRSDADKILIKYLADKQEGRPNNLFLEKISFREFVETKYLLYSKSNKTAKTYKVHRNELLRLIEYFGKSDLDKITTDKIEQYKADNLANGLSKKTVNNRVALISAVLRMAYDQNLIIRMPKIQLLKLDILPPRAIDNEAIQKLVTIAKEKDKLVYDFVIIFLNTGLRLSELVNLKWEDVNFSQRQLLVRKAKSHKFRAIPFNQTLENHLKSIHKESIGEYVFEYEGHHYHENTFTKRFRAIVRTAKIKATIHCLRHTFASQLVQRGVNLYEVQKLLGHSTLSTTERYAHLNMKNLITAVNALDKLNA